MDPPPPAEQDEADAEEPLAAELGEQKVVDVAPPAATKAPVKRALAAAKAPVATKTAVARIGRKHATSKRPPDMQPEARSMLSVNQRQQAIAQYEARVAASGKPASSFSSSSVAIATAITDFHKTPTKDETPNLRDKIQVGGNLFNTAVARAAGKKFYRFLKPKQQSQRNGTSCATAGVGMTAT